MQKRSIQTLFMVLMLGSGYAMADLPNAQIASNPVAMLNLAPNPSFNNLSIVEQLQTIRRLSQNTSSEAFQQLVGALSSNYPLARRTASRSLLENAQSSSIEQKKQLVQALKPCLNNSDPVVQANIVRLLVTLKLPEAQQSLRSFAQSSDKTTQLRAVEALNQENQPCRESLGLIEKYSPYSDVKHAAEEGLQ
jgi:HEAT repeat protein